MRSSRTRCRSPPFCAPPLCWAHRRAVADTTHPTIGVINAPEVADAFRQLGFRVLTGDTFRDAATAVSNALNDGAFPVVLAESSGPGVSPWASSTAAKTRLVVLGTRPDLQLLITGGKRLELPATVDDLLPLVGYMASGSVHGAVQIIDQTPAPEQESLPTAAQPLPGRIATRRCCASPSSARPRVTRGVPFRSSTTTRWALRVRSVCGRTFRHRRAASEAGPDSSPVRRRH
ncbi:hypothetical protein ACVLV4_001709 [Rathayibacter agropyri]